MTIAVRDIAFPQSDRERAEAIFAGDVVLYRQVPEMLALRRRAIAITTETLATDQPETAFSALAPAEIAEAARILRRRYAGDGAVNSAFIALFARLGLEAAVTYRDRYTLRVSPPGEGHQDRHTRPLPPHRDTWGSNLLAQINWWAPIFPLSAGRTIALFPANWRAPIRNSSAAWDLEELLRAIAAARAAGQTMPDYPYLPVAEEMPDWSKAMPIVIEPGDIMCFSGAHLHASVPNRTDRARFSLETRTVCMADLTAGRAAPSIDGRAPRVPFHWFRRLADRRSLGEAVEEAGLSAADFLRLMP